MTLLMVLAHQGEEFVIILPAIMLVGAFFIMRWANKGDDEETAQDGPPADRPVGFVPPEIKGDGEVVLSGAAPSPGRPDAGQTTR